MKKKLLLFAILMIVIFSLVATRFTTNSSPLTGTIGSNYVYPIVMASYESAIIQVKNTGSSNNDLEYVIIAYAHNSASDGRSIATGTLSDNDLDTIKVGDPYYKLIITISEAITDSSSTYELNYTLKD